MCIRPPQFIARIILACPPLELALPVLAVPNGMSPNVGRMQVSCGSIIDPGSSEVNRLITPNDGDGDGLTDETEQFVLFTEPCLPDADGDGLEDGWEVDPAKINPLVDRAGFER